MNLKKNITIDVRMYADSGIGTYIRNLLPRIVELMPEAHFNLLAKTDKIEGLNDHPRIKIIKCESSIYSIKEQRELVAKTPKDTDLFWSPHYNIPMFYRGKLLVTVHDVFHLAMSHLTKGLLQYLYPKILFRAIGKKADAVISVSEFSKKEILRLTPIPQKKIRVVHSGIEKSWYELPDLANTHSRPYILYVGNVKPHKNLKVLVKAFEAIHDKVDHDLIIVGKKDGFIIGDPVVQAMAERLKDRIQFTGFVTHEILQQYFKHAALFVFPSLYEGFGFPPLEAMAAGCPTLVSHAASLPEACGEATLYFDPHNAKDLADKMFLVLSQQDLQNELVAKGKDHAPRFDWGRSAENTTRVIREALH